MIKVFTITPFFSKKKKDGVSNIIENLNYRLKKKVKFYNVKKNTIFNLISYIKKTNILHFHGCWHPIFFKVYVLNLFFNKPIILNSHGMLSVNSFENKSFIKNLIWILYQKKILNTSRKIIVNSKKEYNEVRQLIVKPKKIIIIPNGIEIIKSNKKKKIKTNLKSKKKLNFLYFSRIHRLKGIEELINSWNYVRDPRFILNIYGHGDYNYIKKISFLINKNKNKNKIKFIYNKNTSKHKIYSKSDIMILPTYSESFGLVILEAINEGIVVITSKFTPWNFLKNNSMINFTNIKDTEISKAINQMLGEFKIQKYLKDLQHMRKMIYSCYNWPIVSDSYKNLYDKVIK